MDAGALRVEFSMPATGLAYFPGLARPLVFESDRLPRAQADELRALLVRVAFFELPSRVDAADGPRDACVYQIAVEEPGRSHRVAVCEPITQPGLRRLVEFLIALARERRAAERPAPAR